MRIQTSLVNLMLVKRKGQKMIPSMFLRFAPVLLIAMLSQVSIAATTPAPASTTDPATNVTYITGTCKKTTPAFNISKYFNQEAMLVKNPASVADASSKWDLAKDGAFAGYNVYMCLMSPTSYPSSPPAGFWELMEQKGFTVRRSCNMASELSYPAYHVFVLFDRTLYSPDAPIISVADARAIAAFYVRGGGIYGLTDNCPHIHNVNRMFQSFPPVLAKMQMQNNNAISNFPLYNGNPVGDNQFGHHVAFTGVASMGSGHSLSIPYYNSIFGIGVFAPMGTVVINRVPSACPGEATPPFMYSHPSIIYVDPPVQLVDVPDSCNWGRIVLDTAWTRYGTAPMREGVHRFAANVAAWLVNIERVFERSTSSGGAYALQNCSRNASIPSDDDQDKTQVLGCSNGDAVTLKAPTMLCGIRFAGGAGGDAPKCLALVVTVTAGTTCIVDLQTATIGTYWIIVDGKNTSLQFSVTAASLTPRGTVVAVTGTCVKTSDTAVRGCRDESSITIDWTLPYPRDLTLGLGSSATVCRTFSVSGTRVMCVFQGLNTMPRGRYQTYINGVSTGIPLTVETDIASLNHVLCSGTHTLSPDATRVETPTPTLLATRTPSPTVSGDATVTRTPLVSPSLSATETITATTSLTAEGTTSTTLTQTVPVTSSKVFSTTRTVWISSSLILAATRSSTRTKTSTRTAVLTITGTLWLSTTRALTPSAVVVSSSASILETRSTTWACVNAQTLVSVFAPLLASGLTVRVTDAEVMNGTTVVAVLQPLPGLEDAALHVPWFEPWSAAASVRVVQAPNQLGFADRTGYSAGIRLSFPRGLGSPAGFEGSQPAVVVVTIPPISDYRVYSAEAVVLEVRAADLTLGHLCGGASNSTVAGVVRLEVTLDENLLLAAAQSVVAPVIAVVSAAAAFAAPDMQALVMLAMMPCANSYQRRTFAMFRALSVFTLDDTFEGVLWGNLAANVGLLGLNAAAAAVIAAVRGVPLAAALPMARFPSVFLQLSWMLTFGSTAFAAVQLLAESDTTTENRALAGTMLGVLCFAMPAAVMWYVAQRVEAHYMVYEYSRWKREGTALRVRLLSVALLPVGRWEPSDVRRCLGPTLTRQCRPEFFWPLLPLASPVLVALFSLVRNQEPWACVWVYVALALLHVALLIVVVVCRPLRARIEDWLAAAAYAVTTLYVLFAAVNLAYPPSKAIEAVLGVAGVLQIVVLLIRAVYQIAHIFIARRLSEVVPCRLAFEWYRGRKRVEDDYGEGGDELSRMGAAAPTQPLYADLEDLLRDSDDTVVELETCLNTELYLRPLSEQSDDMKNTLFSDLRMPRGSVKDPLAELDAFFD